MPEMIDMTNSRIYVSIGIGLIHAWKDPDLNEGSVEILTKLADFFPNEIKQVILGEGIRHSNAFDCLGFEINPSYAPIYGSATFVPERGKISLSSGFFTYREHYLIGSSCIDRMFKDHCPGTIVIGDLLILNQMGMIRTGGGISNPFPLIVKFTYKTMETVEIRIITLEKPEGEIFYPKVENQTVKETSIMG